MSVHGDIAKRVAAVAPATTAELTSLTATVNTTNKFVGRQVFNGTSGRPVWAAGDAAGSLWLYADGTTAHTPV